MRADGARPVHVSVVTVALNAAADLPLTLESLIGQDYPHLETIVVDCASWDGSGRLLRRYADALDRIVVAEDAGIYYAMNAALSHVRGDYVLFMNAGDRFFCAEAVSRMVAALEGSPDIFYGDHVYVDGPLELYRRSAPFEWLANRLDGGRIDGDWLDRIPCHQATFARADLLRALRFDTRLRISADHELLFRAHAEGARMQYIDEAVCHYAGGGISVTMGERTRLEGASVYRGFSDRPDLVDRFFYPEGAPFDAQTRRTGIKLGGFHTGGAGDGDLPAAAAWVAGSGGTFLTPERDVGGLEFSGYNRLDGQRAAFRLDGEAIGEIEVPKGAFRLELRFDRLLPAGSLVTMHPSRVHSLGKAEGAAAGLGVSTFRFTRSGNDAAASLDPGETIHFRNGDRNDFAALLGSGWAEPEATHLWSLGPRSDLWLKLAPAARGLRLRVTGNPHVPDGRQQVALHVNGEPAAHAEVDNGGGSDLALDCTHPPWRAGAYNCLSMIPSASATPPPATGDARILGICLWRLSCE